MGAHILLYIPKIHSPPYVRIDEGLWQGDIVLDPDEYEATWNKTQHTVYASIKGGRWPRGRVPYVIDSSLGKSYCNVGSLF